MMTLTDVARAFEQGKKQYERLLARPCKALFDISEVYGEVCNAELWEESIQGRVASADNAEYMSFLLQQRNMAGKLQLIYIDPPFYSNGKYQASVQLGSDILGRSAVIKTGAYDDRWGKDVGEYLTMLTARFMLMRELLAETGSICVHLDWHVSHYVKIIMDQIFGEENFINELIWTYKSGGTSKRSFAKKHDTLLLYGKSKNYVFNPQQEKSYNRGLKPYRFKGVEEFEDEKGWYTVVNMKDVWSIDMVGRTSAERTGYATQKPERLLERLIAACSNEGDICADFFAGSGTLGAVCSRLNRRWLMCDAGELAAANQIKRLVEAGYSFAAERPTVKNGAIAETIDSAKHEELRRAREAALHENKTIGELEAHVNEGRIELLNYKADLSHLPYKENEKIAEYIKSDSLSLIKFWSVDFDFDGKTHKGERILTAGERSLDFDSSKKTGIINIMGYDAFGNRFFSSIV